MGPTTTPRGSARRRAACIAALLIAPLAACSEVPDPAARVPDPSSARELTIGTVIGMRGEYGGHVWRGIPYAAPPTGDHRWRAPAPPRPLAGPFEALDSGPPCPQLASPIGGIGDAEPGSVVGSEDCLTLDVYAPRMAAGELPRGRDRLPVMVWIHGGGNSIGAKHLYHGGRLAGREQVIVVAVNYRLGPFGWFRHPALRGRGTSAADRSGNYGTLDLIAALRFVRENAAAFGGDPDRITVFGESAGGRNTVSLLVSPLARGLFHRAIVQSGAADTTDPNAAEAPADATPPGHPNSGSEVVARLLVAAGRAPDRAAALALAAQTPSAELAAFLRELPPEAILEACGRGTETGMLDFPQLFADGTVLPPDAPLARLSRSGAWNEVPVVFGTNRDENRVFLLLDPRFGRRLFGVIPRPHDPERFLVVAEYLSRMWKAMGADEPARAVRRSQGPAPFVYRFDWDEALSLPGLRLDRTLGASHGFEIPFVFEHWDLGPAAIGLFIPWNRAGREELSRAMGAYWAEFARTGAPGRGGREELPEWLPFEEGHPAAPKTLILDTPADGGIRMSPLAERRGALLAAVAADPRLPTSRDRCTVYRMLAERSRGFDRAGYERLGECANFPYDAFPWEKKGSVSGAESRSG